jgi:hypothetical protein
MEESTAISYQDQGRATVGADAPRAATNVTEFPDTPQPRIVGSPLPGGGYTAPPSIQEVPRLHEDFGRQEDSRRLPSPPPPQPQSSREALAGKSSTTGLQRAVNVLRAAIPLVQKLLPLIDGNIATTLSNILTPQPPPKPPTPPSSDIEPIQKTLVEIQTQHRDLKEQVIEQNASLKRVEDHLEMVRQATDRNTLEQQELLEDLKSVGSKVNVVAVIAIGLLAISVLLNMLLYMHIQRVLP